MSKFVKATVLKPIGGYGYFKGDQGSFSQEDADNLAKKGLITTIESPVTTDRAKEEAKKNK